MLLEKGNLYDGQGNRRFSSYSQTTGKDVTEYLLATDSCAFTQSLVSDDCLDIIVDLAQRGNKVMANRKGQPNLVRIPGGNAGTRWIIDAGTWGIRELDVRDLVKLKDFYRYVGIGFKPSPGSLGRELMRVVWGMEKLKKHTSPSLACEMFIRNNAVGGIVQTPGAGSKYTELLMLDMSSAWISQYVIHPTGTAIPFEEGCDYLDEFFTYFVRCDVYIKEELALGPFPYRTGRRDGKRVVYPTLPGIYKDCYLWKEQIDDCRRAGCYVKEHNGYGWKDYTTDNFHWSNRIYNLRVQSSDEFITRSCKQCATAGVGSHFRPRESFYLVSEGDYELGDRPVIVGDDCVDLYLRREEKFTDSLMVHWYAYTIAMCNSRVYQFALPFAKEGRLVSIDYDSVLVVEKDERHRFIKREDARHFDLPPGTWLWMLLHNVHDIKDRSFKADEMSKTPGEPRVLV